MSEIPQNIQSIVDQDGAVVLDIEHNVMVTLNSTGAFIWDGLRRGKLLDDIIRELALETGTAVDRIDHDMHSFINELKSQHLLSV